MIATKGGIGYDTAMMMPMADRQAALYCVYEIYEEAREQQRDKE
jgi:hypothetical protein